MARLRTLIPKELSDQIVSKLLQKDMASIPMVFPYSLHSFQILINYVIEAAENVIFARAFNSDHQMDLITYLAARFAEEKGVYRVLIVDSIIALFRADFCGRGELSERQQKLNQMLSRLMKVAEEFNIAIFITNQMSADPGAGTISIFLVINTGF